MMRRRGFTLIEMTLAIVVLTVVLTSMARYTGQYLHTVATSTARTTAAEVARERIGLIDADPSYTTLGVVWATAGTGGDVTGFPGYPNMRRVTTALRLQNAAGVVPARDYTIVTVRVTEPTMGAPIDVTTVAAR